MVKLKNLIAGGMLVPSLLFGKFANAEEPKNLEEKLFSPPWISVEYQKKKIENHYNKTIIPSEDSLNISLDEEKQIDILMKNITSGKINSYADLINNSRNFSEYQKIILGSLFMEQMYVFSYNSLRGYDVLSQEDLFKQLQESFKNNTGKNLGTCTNFSVYNELFLMDSGITNVASVSEKVLDYELKKGILHAMNILRLKDETIFVDGPKILKVNTKNIEKALAEYQKTRHLTLFIYDFYEKNKFRYKLITKEGKNYFDFVGYDETMESFKKNTLDYTPKLSFPLKVIISEESHKESTEINLFGLFFKKGKITGGASSLYDEIKLNEFGFKKIGITPKSLEEFGGMVAGIQASAIRGEVFYKDFTTAYFLENKKSEEIKGSTGNVFFSTNNNEEFNFGAELSLHATQLAKDFKTSFEASYKFENKNINIQPYFISQFKDVDTKLEPSNGGFSLELNSGIIFDFKLPKKIIFSVDPNISKRPWENEYGIGAKLKHKNFEIAGRGYKTKSKYWANPNKKGNEIRAKLDFRYLSGEVIYKTEIEDYDGEKEKNTDLEFKTSLKI